jgi:hypothetical protein
MERVVALGFGLLFVGIGGGALIAPRPAAAGYGIPLDDPAGFAFVRAAGARDAIAGALVLSGLGERRSLRRTLRWLSLIGLIDGAILMRERGLRPQHVVHLGGFAALALAARRLRE